MFPGQGPLQRHMIGHTIFRVFKIEKNMYHLDLLEGSYLEGASNVLALIENHQKRLFI